eukprot:CAMPEP_0170133128 /NCGR_PEP_ID=MMETSP0033_2-20121228/1087_1 /TAXON_ID=195969 /ORGANISM="Dolichomastix tenuilepis, Strain CCMP3274" /LENGTH=152 /DNA_ID=CAMNT_0010368587 /DNA_START=213 /DNA_END=671 /DNA_ORIENTATION=-
MKKSMPKKAVGCVAVLRRSVRVCSGLATHTVCVFLLHNATTSQGLFLVSTAAPAPFGRVVHRWANHDMHGYQHVCGDADFTERLVVVKDFPTVDELQLCGAPGSIVVARPLCDDPLLHVPQRRHRRERERTNVRAVSEPESYAHLVHAPPLL